MDSNTLAGIVLGTIFASILGWEIVKLIARALVFYAVHKLREEEPPRINPDDFTISDSGQVVEKPICPRCKSFLRKIGKGRYKCYTCPEDYVCPHEESRPEYSFEQNVLNVGYTLYFGRDKEHHGANLCTLIDFDANGDDTRKMILEALNDRIQTKH